MSTVEHVHDSHKTNASLWGVTRSPTANMPIRLGTIFHISLYGMATLSGGVLSWAEGEPLPTGLTIPLALTALLVNERLGLLRINGLFANLLGMLAFVFPAIEFFGDNPEGRLLAGAHLLVYLQWILLFQKKDRQHYWWICTLSVLQVAVAAVLTNSGWFGIWLCIYLFLSIWTLSVFSLFQMEQEFSGENPNANFLAGKRSTTSRVRDTIQHDPLESWITFRFVGGVCLMAMVAMFVGLMFFLFIPRVHFGRFTGLASLAPTGGASQTGFSEQVRLGDMGQILESTEVAFRMKVIDNVTGNLLDVPDYAARFGYDEPLFRGGVMTAYREGRWSPSRSEYQKLLPDTFPLQYSVSQIYELNPLGSDLLFAMRPIHGGYLVGADGEIGIHSETSTLMRYGAQHSEVINYRILSLRYPKSAFGARDEVRPLPLLRNFTRRRCLSLSAETSRLQTLAQEVVSRAEEEASARNVSLENAQAHMLESYLRDSGHFTYTLSAKIDDPSIDPVEDFLFNRHSGHCEYYATALALMLRSVGIPSRLVTGFKGGIKNPLTNQFEVQQRHAHAWVEAYYDDDWFALDATPSAERLAALEEAGASKSFWIHLAAFSTRIWQDYVLNLSASRQQQELYGPLRRTAVGAWQVLTSSDSRFGSISDVIRSMFRSPEEWVSLKGGLIAFVLLLSLVGLAAAIRQGIQWFQQIRGKARHKALGSYRRVDFYEEFLRIVGKHGFVPGRSQTPAEFADSVRDGMAKRLDSTGMDLFPEQLTDTFYRVRFGANEVERDEHIALASALARFADALDPDANGSRQHNADSNHANASGKSVS